MDFFGCDITDAPGAGAGIGEDAAGFVVVSFESLACGSALPESAWSSFGRMGILVEYCLDCADDSRDGF